MPSLNWIGKEKIENHDKEVVFRLMKKNEKLSLGKNSENLIVEGDNLEALKALMPHYAGQVKCIYIDPPYNTGNEGWEYNDKVNSPRIKEWLRKTVGIDDLERHDKWLCMMYPRLKLLRDLLKDDGVIFISIDDNEQHTLKFLLGEIFGEENFIAELPTVMNLKGNQDEFGFAGTHEYTLVWAKNKSGILDLGKFDIDEEEMEDWKEDEIGFFKQGANLKATGINAPKEKRPNLFFPIYINQKDEVSLIRKSKKDNEILPITDGKKMSWRWSKNKITNEKHNIIVVRNGVNVSIYKKQRPNLGDLPSKKPKSIFYRAEYSSGNGTAQLKSIFGEKVFNNPKPLELISDFIKIGSEKDSIILDSFAGSGTTAHAVLQLNKEDKDSNRKFILVEMEEKIARKITSERVRRVAKTLGGSFEYVMLGDTLFESSGAINQKVSFQDLASYIYFIETHTNINPKRIKDNFIGEYNGQEFYLLFKEKDKNILNRVAVLKIGKSKLPKIVYADKCLLDQNILDKYGIIFKQIPYSVKIY